MSAAEIFTILFYYSGITSIMLGSYSIYVNSKAKLNRIFAVLCISIVFWGIGFSLAVDADQIESCMFWRRVSAVGWGSMYSIFLHFVLVLTNKDKLLKKRWLYIFIHLPAIISVYVFAISNQMTQNQYHLVRTPYGWTNIAVNNHWDWFFYFYYIGYMLCGLGIIWVWGKTSSNSLVKRQAYKILAAFVIAFLLGSISDNVFNRIYSESMPQIAPIIILLPTLVIYYEIIRYGFMKPKRLNEDDVILNPATREKIYTNLSLILVIGSVGSYFLQYLYYQSPIIPLPSSLLFLVMGITVYSIKSIRFNEYIKDILLIALVAVSIPSITLIFIDFGSVTIWAFSFLFIVIALLFNTPIVLTTVAISTITTQILVWILRPTVALSLDYEDYIGRIGIIIISIWFAFYVNKIYIQRLKQNSDQLILQRFISEISSDFINVNQSNIDIKMDWVIRIVGKLFQVDQIHLGLLDTEEKTGEFIKVWDIEDKNFTDKKVFHETIEDIKWFSQQLIKQECIYIEDVHQLPEQALQMKQILMKRQVRTVVIIPIVEKEKSLRVLELASVGKVKSWTVEELRILKIIANTFTDALTKVDAENEISYMAYHDHLTGLPNRRLFRDRLVQAIALAKRTEKMVGILFIDFKSFKTVNDTLGHEGGDSLLKVIAELLMQTVRQSDTVCRFGGADFLIMINNINHANDIIQIAKKIISLMEQTVSIQGQAFNLSTSVGISIYPFDGIEPDALIKNADIAMYKAKEKGKNQYVVCSTELKEEVMFRIKITNSLYHALDRNEFYLHYQPQVRLATNEIIGVEALIRWMHPELGFISPAVFIPIAEQIGLINEIGEWVLKTACIQNKKWQLEGYSPVCMAVNVSANQLWNNDFISQVENVLAQTGLESKYLEVEITENVAMNETNDIVRFLLDIRNLGITISIDDFGTDYSSLSRLKEFPVDKLKIDKQFIDTIGESGKDKAIVKAIISLAKNLDLKVIAEGVEIEEQLEFLKQENCDEVQGYYFYKPMPPEEIEKILKR